MKTLYEIFAEWHCDVCGALRPDEKISVKSIDISEGYGLAQGIVKLNVKHCNDNAECGEKAQRWRLSDMLSERISLERKRV